MIARTIICDGGTKHASIRTQNQRHRRRHLTKRKRRNTSIGIDTTTTRTRMMWITAVETLVASTHIITRTLQGTMRRIMSGTRTITRLELVVHPLQNSPFDLERLTRIRTRNGRRAKSLTKTTLQKKGMHESHHHRANTVQKCTHRPLNVSLLLHLGRSLSTRTSAQCHQAVAITHSRLWRSSRITSGHNLHHPLRAWSTCKLARSDLLPSCKINDQ